MTGEEYRKDRAGAYLGPGDRMNVTYLLSSHAQSPCHFEVLREEWAEPASGVK